MKYGIIIGSHRHESQSTKVGEYIKGLLEKKESVEVYTIDMRNEPIPFWSEAMWDKESDIRKHWTTYSDNLKQCDAFVIISPEWSGMVPSALKNFFLFCDDGELAFKPGLIVTISSGRGGAYPVAELRMSSYKNTHISYLPEHIIVRDVTHVLNDEDGETDDDIYIRKRINYAVNILEQYSYSLKSVRDSAVIDLKSYPHGM